MKTIRQPKPKSDPSLTYTIMCKNKRCGAVFEAHESELRVVYDQRDGDAVVLTCQYCETETWVALH